MLKYDVTIRNGIREHWQDIRDEDISLVVEYLRQSPISAIDGGVLSAFEQKFANFIGAKHAVAYCNGTAAIHAASYAVGADKDFSMLMSQYGYHGTVNAVLENNAKVILTDYERSTLNIDCKVAEKHCEDVKGLLITHCWGNVVDMDAVQHLKEKYGLKIISDASHAHGAKWRGVNIGTTSIEDVACFSLGKNKLISAGELGVAITNDDEIYDRLLFIGHPNRVPKALMGSKLKIYCNSIGNKYRPHVLAMVLAMSQIDRYSQKRHLNICTNEYLEKSVGRIPGFLPIRSYSGAERVYWKLLFRLDRSYWGNISAQKIAKLLTDEGLTLEQFHNYNIVEHEKLWNHPRYRGMVDNRSVFTTPDDILVLPGYIKIDDSDMKNIVRVFEKISFQKGRLV